MYAFHPASSFVKKEYKKWKNLLTNQRLNDIV